ncbi:TetR/AcrR family transcriptional regulator [Sporomusa sphaeroides DSM 2875]|uniref:TetR/AcrR family transcriptional regulator n=1 Tax=Sporomusa sphaeroides TaxID=47679 RepID=UPI00202FBB19|nr:TetR/AcrR family transcriptional regulator [Sporomusa sphaeroides]MCM0759784.1 TetR/AcrR family transcriptional regulator [Sporomusa sphaeroides DSM 2875]
MLLARPPQDPKIKMDEILDVVEPLFAAKGYRKTTISDIAKELGGARGLLYYYFKSKEEILEALINRQISKLLTDVKNMVSSADIIPSRKIEIMVNAVFRTAQREDGLFLEFLSDEKNFHFKNKIFRQATLLLKPWLLRIIEEGVSKQYFRISHLPAALTFIMSIILCLGDTLCEKTPNEELGYHLVLAASLIERALGMPEKTLHLSLSIA